MNPFETERLRKILFGERWQEVEYEAKRGTPEYPKYHVVPGPKIKGAQWVTIETTHRRRKFGIAYAVSDDEIAQSLPGDPRSAERVKALDKLRAVVEVAT